MQPVSKVLMAKLTSLLCIALVTGGVPFQFVENEHFIEFLKLLRCNYEIPGRLFRSNNKGHGQSCSKHLQDACLC